MKKNYLTVLFILLMVTLLAVPAAVYGDSDDEPKHIDITVDGATVTCEPGRYWLDFSSAEDTGYTVTIDAPDYMNTNIFVYDEYECLNEDITLDLNIPGSYTGANIRRIFSFYGVENMEYSIYLVNSFADEAYTSGTAKVTVTRTEKAGITDDGFEFWSDNSTGEEVATIMNYRGGASEVTVPGEVAGMRVRTVFNDFMAGNDTVKKLVFSEGIEVLRNNVAAGCPNLREVVLPSTFNENSNSPFQGCRLDNISFPKGNNDYSYKDHCLIYWGTSLQGHYGSDETFRVPDGIEHINMKAFHESAVKILYLPDSVKRVSSQQQVFDELHVEAGYCDIDDQQWHDEYNGYGNCLKKVYARHNSFTEKQAAKYAQYGIEFEVEGGEAQKVYEVKTSDEEFMANVPSYPVYRYAGDDHYYGTFTAPETGQYIFWANGQGVPVFDYITDSKNNKFNFRDATETTNYDNDVTIELTKGETYIFCISDHSQEDWGSEEKTSNFDLYIQTPTAVNALFGRNTEPKKTVTKKDLPGVTIYKPAAARKAMTVKWKKLSKKSQKKIASIKIQYSKDKRFKKGVKTVTVKKSASSRKISKLTSGKTYYVRIRTYKKSNNVVHISKWSTVKRARIK